MDPRSPNRGTDFSRFGTNFKLTKIVKWLLIANVVVFLLELLVARLEGGLDFILLHLAISFDRTSAGEIWQPFTYLFLHDPQGISHILWNMLMLWMFGSPLESFWGGKRFFGFYCITGLCAAATILLVSAALPSQRAIPTLGASGALYGLLVAFGFNFPNSLVYLFGLFPIRGKTLVLLFIGLGIVQSLTLSAANVSLAAHFGGMVAGFFLVTGTWRPSRMFGWIRWLWLRFRYQRLKKRFQVVGKNPDDRGGGYLN
jgi:membrane associated rhomboid family serine protease